MAIKFADVEINTHSPFYQRVDELLGLNTDEFYTSFTDDPVLKSRMDFLDDVICHEDDLVSVGVFSMVEGAILYTSFAFLMSFQANGNNYITNIHAGLTFSVKDENLHSEGGAWAFRTLMEEKIEAELMSKQDVLKVEKTIRDAARKIYAHEHKIIEMIFSEGSIDGITAGELKAFAKHRINLCLGQLGYTPMFEITSNPIGEWFYDMIGGDVQHDFFVKIGSSYNRNWTKTDFVWTEGGLQGRTWEEIDVKV